MRKLRPPRRLKSEPEDAGWKAADLTDDDLVDDDWIRENTKEVLDGLEQSDSSESS